MISTMNYATGDNVIRLEDRPQVAAVVISTEDGPDCQLLELAYEEGGTGWWPAEAVAPADA